jgi:thioredoxin reductase
MSTETSREFDIAIVGGGPAGLSAAIVLGRACRRVVLFDDGEYRNFAAQSVHCYLGLDGISPDELRDRGRKEAYKYGVCIQNVKVSSTRRIATEGPYSTQFEVSTVKQSFACRALILATGIKDMLPQINGLAGLYGRFVHHCPYCDGWEYRDKRLVALGSGSSAVELALSLRGWSVNVTACTNGHTPSDTDGKRLARNEVQLRVERVAGLAEEDNRLRELHFEHGEPVPCDALFFSADQTQSSELPTSLGCRKADDGLITTDDKQCPHVPGLFVAGDLHSDVQMVSVAAAEGVIAAKSANKMLLEQEAAARCGSV